MDIIFTHKDLEKLFYSHFYVYNHMYLKIIFK